MKSIFILCIAAFASFSVYAANDEAITYNDKIISEQTKIGEAILAFSSAPNEFSLEQIKTQANNGLAELNKLKPFEGNKEFLNSAKTLFKFYASITKSEYKKLLILLQDKDKYTTEQLTQKINELSSAISKKEGPLDDKFQAAQKAFAKKYGFSLSKNDLDEKMKNATESE